VVLKKDAEDQSDRSCEKWRSITSERRRAGASYVEQKEWRLTGVVTSCAGTAFWNTLLKERKREG
jgi:hypothetical protein